MVNEECKIFRDLEQYAHALEASKKRHEEHLKRVFCIVFKDDALKESVERNGLPDTIFVNQDDFYCVEDSLAKYFKVIPVKHLENGQVVFKWTTEGGNKIPLSFEGRSRLLQEILY